MTPSHHEPLRLGVGARAIAEDPAFRELTRKRSMLVRTCLGFAFAWFALFIAMTAFAHELMAIQILPGLTLAYVLGLTQFVSVWVFTGIYLHRSRHVFQPLQELALDAAVDKVEPKGEVV